MTGYGINKTIHNIQLVLVGTSIQIILKLFVFLKSTKAWKLHFRSATVDINSTFEVIIYEKSI